MSWNTLRAARGLGPADTRAHIAVAVQAVHRRTEAVDPAVIPRHGIPVRVASPRVAVGARVTGRVIPRARAGRVAPVPAKTAAGTPAPMAGTLVGTTGMIIVHRGQVQTRVRTVGVRMNHASSGPDTAAVTMIGAAKVGALTAREAGAAVGEPSARTHGAVPRGEAVPRVQTAPAGDQAVGRRMSAALGAAGTMIVRNARAVGTRGGVAMSAAWRPGAAATGTVVARVATNGGATDRTAGAVAARIARAATTRVAGTTTTRGGSAAQGPLDSDPAAMIVTTRVVATAVATSRASEIERTVVGPGTRHVRDGRARRAGVTGAGATSTRVRATSARTGTTSVEAVMVDPGKETGRSAAPARGTRTPGALVARPTGTSGRSTPVSSVRRTSPRLTSTST